MPFSKFSLPEPVDRDVWDRLASESRPIVVYGMGNGADKLFARFEERGIRAAAVFASDGFVRGQFFHGMRVMRFSEVRAAYPDFVIVLAFASDRPELLAAVGEMSRSNDLLVPDMPLAGGAYFDRAFYAEHWGEIRAAYDLFPDDESRSVYAAVVRNRLSGAVAPLLSCGSGAEEIFGLFDGVEHFLDVGAYRGDTVRRAIASFPALREVTAVEPDGKNFARLAAFAETVASPRIRCVEGAAWSEEGEAAFAASGNRNSSLLSSSYRNREESIRLLRLDRLGLPRVDLIKYDVEGAEREALAGSEELILRDRPALLVSVYHKSADLFELPLMLRARYPFYRFLLRRKRCLPAWEIDLICLPERNLP